MGGLINWAKDAIGGLWSKASDAVKTVWHFVEHVATYVGTIVHLVGGAWGDMLGAGRWLGGALSDVATGLYSFARWTVRTLVPDAVRHAITSAARHAVSLVEHAVGVARQLAADVRSWAWDRLQHLTARLAELAHNVWRRLDQVASTVTDGIRRAADLIEHPWRLATLIAPFLWQPLWRFLRSKEQALARWLLRRSVPFIVAAAHEIEHVLTDII